MNKILNQKLICTDSRDGFPRVKSKTVDIVVTSPPYNLGVKYNKYNDNLKYSVYLKTMIMDLAFGVKDVLKDNGSFFLNVGFSGKNPWLYMDVAKICQGIFILQNNIAWSKSVCIGDKTFGQFKPINSDRYLNNNFEMLFHFTKTGKVKIDRKAIGVPYVCKCNLKRHNKRGIGEKEDLHCPGNVWHIPYRTIQKNRGHPAVFPPELVERCIKMCGYNKDTVLLDPYVGSGSSLVACVRLGIKGIGIDNDEKYINLSIENIKNAKTKRKNPKKKEQLVSEPLF